MGNVGVGIGAVNTVARLLVDQFFGTQEVEH